MIDVVMELTAIISVIDFIWLSFFLLTTVFFSLIFKGKWISKQILLTFMLLKIAVGIAMSIDAVAINGDVVGYHFNGLVYADLFRQFITGESFDYIFTNPFVTTGVYFVIELESFYKMASSLDRDILNFEQLFTNKILSEVDVEINTVTPILNRVYKDINSFSSRQLSAKYSERVDKLSNLMISNRGTSKMTDVYNLFSKVRTENLQKLIYYEEIINFFKDVKDMI